MQERYAEAPALSQAGAGDQDDRTGPLACRPRETGAIGSEGGDEASLKERQSSYLLAHAARDSSLEGQGESPNNGPALELEPTYLWAPDQLVELCCREGKAVNGLQI